MCYDLNFLSASTKLLLSAAMAAMLLMTTINAPTKAHAQSSGACNCVIFRLDDVQDSWIVPVQSAIINKFIERNETLDIALIMNSIGNDPAIVNEVRQALATGLIETSLHGWNHVDYSKLSLQQQHDTLQIANAKMQELFGRESAIFVTPYNAYNDDTLRAMNQLGLKIISSEFDGEIESIYDPDNPDSPGNKVYKATAGSDIKDSQGIYHMPQVVGFYTYDSDPPTKTPLSLIEEKIDSTIASYGYAVVTLHPQDFTVKDAGNKPTETLSQKEIKDLDTLITWIKDQKYSTKSFSEATHVSLPPIIDKASPEITPPPDKAVVSSSNLTRVDLGRPFVSDNVDSSPAVANDAPAAGFAQGMTRVTWTATDKAGNVATAIQYVLVVQVADKTRPTITIAAPASGATISANASTTIIQVKGTASDGDSGVKAVEVRTNNTGYKAAKQEISGSWSNWTATVKVKQSGNTVIIARATDFFGNQQWANIPVTVLLNTTAQAAPAANAPANHAGASEGRGAPQVPGNDGSAPPAVRDNLPGANELMTASFRRPIQPAG
jgi:peptidoglycan/xylan/chitin deacetylase (PgdA/CDA1 family)